MILFVFDALYLLDDANANAQWPLMPQTIYCYLPMRTHISFFSLFRLHTRAGPTYNQQLFPIILKASFPVSFQWARGSP